VAYSNAWQIRPELASALASGADAIIAVVPSQLMLQFTWAGLDRVMAVYPSASAASAAAD